MFVRTIYVLLFLLFISSCEKESSDENLFGTCDADGVFTDTQSISTKLVGTWKWTKSACGLCVNADTEIFDANKRVMASFTSDGTFSVVEDSEIIEEGTWQFKEFDATRFYISLEPSSANYLRGSIRVCDSELISDARASDGPAYLYVKVN